MTDTAKTPTPDEAVERALAAAEAAADAAAEAQAAARAVAAAPAALAAAPQAAAPGARRALVLGGAAAVCGLLSLGAAGMIYLRAVADLHEAAELQAKAAGMLIDQIGSLSGLEQAIAPETLLRKADAEALQTALAAQMPAPPQDLAPLRSDLMAAIAEVKLELDALKARPAATDTTELTMMLGETLRRLEALPQTTPAKAPRPAPAAAPKAAAAVKKPKARPAKPAVQASPSPFSFP